MLKVKIKTWERMAEEYGVDEDTINVPASFIEMMEAAMPKDRIIEVADRPYSEEGRYTWEPKTSNLYEADRNRFYITREMVEYFIRDVNGKEVFVED